VTRDEILRLRAEVQAEADSLREQLAAALKKEELLTELLDLHENERAIIVPNMQAPTAVRHDRPGRPTETKHPFPKALATRGLTVTEWAAKHGHNRGRVKSWFMPGSGGRRIPRDVAEAIEKELGIPATARTWKNGIA
jgi:hypothetical protein